MARDIVGSEDKFDLEVAARAVVDRILAMRDQPENEGLPVIAVMGEAHNKPGHRLLQQAVMKLCKQRGLEVAYQVEQDHNVLGRILKSRAGMQLTPAQIDKLTIGDKFGSLAVRSMLTHEPIRYAPASAENVLGFCLQQQIRVAFTDAMKRVIDPVTGHKILDLRDKDTFTAAAHYLKRDPKLTEEISVESPEGMAIRNNVMVKKTWDSLQRKAADVPYTPDVIIQHCGYEHISGNTAQGFRFEDSLSVRFAETGFPVLSVFPQTDKCIEQLPDEAAQHDDTTLFVKGLSDVGFDFKDIGEPNAINGFVNHSNGVLTRHEVRDNYQQWQRDLAMEAKALLKRAPS